MTALSKTALKALWKAYFQPTSADFSNLIDSWTDYKVGLEALGQAVSAGSVGVPRYVSTTTVEFLSVGATGQDLLGAGTAASARSVIGLSGLTLPVSVANGGTGVASLSANHVLLGNGASPVQLVAPGASGNVLTSDGTTWQSAAPAGASNKFIQQVYSEYSAYASGTTVMVFDDTIPQNTEGTEFMTVTITPTSTSNYLLIEANAFFTTAGGALLGGAIFRDSNADALAAGIDYAASSAFGVMMTIRYRMLAPSTSATTFKFRAGPNGGTIYFNGYSGARIFGAITKSTFTVTEIAP